MVRWCNKDEFSRKLKAEVKISEWLRNTCLLLYFSTDLTDHPFPSFISFFLFLKLKWLLDEVSLWTHRLMKMSLENMAWFANTEVCKAGFVILKRTSSLPALPPTLTILHLPFFLCSGQEMKVIVSKEKNQLGKALWNSHTSTGQD